MSQIGIEIIGPSKTRIRNLYTPGVLLKAGMPELKASITKIKHRPIEAAHTYDASISIRTVAHNCQGKIN